MKHYGYLVVEGQHDVEFVAQLLKVSGLRRVKYKKDLEPFWYKVIPDKFPIDDDLLKRVPVPTFFENESHSIAVNAAQGITRLAETLEETCKTLDYAQIASFGLVLDADHVGQTPPQRFAALLVELQKQSIDLPRPAAPGEIAGERPAFGVYILPDNKTPGTLEDILLQCAQVNYANLALEAEGYIERFDRSQLTREDKADFNKPAGQKKAHIGSVASILKPGKSIQVSIQDNRWLDGAAIDLPEVRAIRSFLATLLALS
jgi:hypothetical protein